MYRCNVVSRIAGRAMLTALCLPALLTAPPASAQGDLLIAPTRLVLDGRQGSEVILNNIGGKEATYRITLELRRMTPDGDLEEVAKEDANATEQAALDMVRYAPRRVILPPGQPQSIRVSARAAPELPDGEYRVHMSFNAIPDTQAVEERAAGAPDSGFSIKLTPIYGITMPVIVRKGAVQATASLANPKLGADRDGPVFSIDMIRNGNASVYGDLKVSRPGSGDPVLLVRGIGVYPEIGQRHARFNVTPEQAALLRGPLHIEFTEPADKGGATLATLDATLP